MPHLSLSQLQTWFQAVITSPMPLEQAIEAARGSEGWDAGLLHPPSPEESPLPGLRIYARGYWLRLLECLETEYPAVAKTMGKELFSFFAKAYLHHHPSTSTTLFDLGAGFADFLQATQPAGTPEANRAGLQFIVDLARLERARSEVLRSRGLEGQSRAAPDWVAYLQTGAQSFQLSPCLRLLRAGFPLTAYLHAIDRQDEVPEAPSPNPCILAVSRMHYRVQMLELEPWQAALLDVLPRTSTLQQALRAAAEALGNDRDANLANVIAWAPSAMAKGILIAA